MRGKPKPNNRRIHASLTFLALMIGGSFIIVALVVVLALGNIRSMSKKIATRDMASVIRNSRAARDLSMVFNGVDLLRHTFYGNNEHVLSKGGGLIRMIRVIRRDVDDPELGATLDALSTDLEFFVSHCGVVNRTWEDRRRIDDEASAELTKLEHIIGELLLQYTLDGRDAAFVEQILALTLGYRERLLQVGKRYAELGPTHFTSLVEADASPVIVLIDDLLLALQTITASIPVVARSGERIAGKIREYREIVLRLHAEMRALNARWTDFEQSRKKAMTAIEAIDEKISDATRSTSDAIDGIIVLSGAVVLGLSIIVVIATGLGAAWILRTNIKNPMKAILSGIGAFGRGELDTRIKMNRGDEWGEIEKAFNTMARDLSTAYAALRDGEARFRELTDLLPQPVFEMDPGGTFTYVNRRVLEMFGYTEADIEKGLDYRRLMTPEDVERIRRKNRRRPLDHREDEGEYTGVRKDGGRMPIQVRNAPIVREGLAVGIRGVVMDLTERKKSEAALIRARDELVSANRRLKREMEEREEARKALRESERKLERAKRMEAIGHMAGGIAHDLNNILSGIVSYPELILMDLPPESSLRKPVETMMKSGRRAADIVSDLLTIARDAAAGKQVRDLNSLVEEYFQSAEHERLKALDPSISFDARPSQGPLNIECSPPHIAKSIMNLVINASEAIEESGSVVVSTHLRRLDEPLESQEEFRRGEYAVLRVSDSGSGISPDDLERIFEPFYTRKAMGRSGTGLGLTVVWNTVRSHSAHIHVSTDDDGTVFELYFPITMEKAALPGGAVEIETIRGHGETILVVDDEEIQREIAADMLTRLGYSVETVPSGEAAIEYLETRAVDLVMLDMLMHPGMNGREAYERILRGHPGQKAVIVSGFSDSEEVRAAQKSGAGRFIRKPYTLGTIGPALREELNRQPKGSKNGKIQTS